MTSNMCTWSASSADAATGCQCPVDRYAHAVAAEVTVGARLSALVASALAAGFDRRDLLNIPAIRQTLRAGHQALAEYRDARDLLPA